MWCVVYRGGSGREKLLLLGGLTTTAGVVTLPTDRVILADWQTLTDALLAPQSLGWFGVVEQLKTVDRSGGWGSPPTIPCGRRLTPGMSPGGYGGCTVSHLRFIQRTATWRGLGYEVQVAKEASDGLCRLPGTGTAPVVPTMQCLRVIVVSDPAADEL
jgi:hypothetical protein